MLKEFMTEFLINTRNLINVNINHTPFFFLVEL